MTERGTYTLLVELTDPAVVEFGALGERDLPAGHYAYTGSAFGPGGFSRVERHREVAAGERDVRHWHVDYLLGDPRSRVAEVVKSPGADVECEVSRSIDAAPVAGVGCSDCQCGSHLQYAENRDELVRKVRRAHEAARG
ncbi:MULTISPECIES: GIY-YIG nuclease family protein [Halorussus]|uniref:GIY-YIG nuclease family protein n=1 Tax=Halorussus TaxID=1070314 RepID=UPI0020A0260C|nr:GIY-YIG nuclease family protein [Halorussus vallis]USZ76150.1 GIY-YIG nuclease family protein [Halorussus vallis]